MSCKNSYQKWVLTLGVAAAAPGLAMAGPWSLFKSEADTGGGNIRQVSAQDERSHNQQVAEEVAKALRAAKLNGHEIEIKFDKGVAVLSGQIASAEQKAQATRAVASVPDVETVDNKMTIMATPPKASREPSRLAASAGGAQGAPSVQFVGEDAPNSPFAGGQGNQAVAQGIAQALSEAGLSGYDIEVRHQNGTATLGGRVANVMEANRAIEVTRSVPGVNRVNSQLDFPGRTQQGMPQGMPQHVQAAAMQQQMMMPVDAQGHPLPPQAPGYPLQPAAYQQGAPGQQMMPAHMQQMGQAPMPYPGVAPAAYNSPNLPEHAWPSYAAYPNSAAVTYPQQYSASAWPYIGPFYPYPQVPLGWRKVSLEWDDGYWNLDFDSRTDKWFWFLHPKNWD